MKDMVKLSMKLVLGVSNLNNVVLSEFINFSFLSDFPSCCG